ncbi:hypothetical protein [Longivirga aurantiaca]|uniref:Uncharacterized protein n=1 Tax=Longivirga aurantiaca TaxID=1837743 RepID=A0ABW1T3B8_9ACTN
MSDDAPRAGAEAARLVAAAQEWLRTAAPHLAPVDDDGRTCSCPVCRGIARLREGDPDTVARWVDGAVAAFEHVVSEAAAGRAPAAATATDASDAGPGEEPHEDARHDDAGDDGAGHGAPTSRRVRRVPLDEPGTAAPARPQTAREE